MTHFLRIECEDPAASQLARQIAARHDLIIDDHQTAGELTLVMRDDGFELRDSSVRPDRGLRIDFTSLARRGRSSANLSRRQPLARAMGKGCRTIIDATAGLGGDASLLAAMGFTVTAIERHPVLAAMLEEAIIRSQSDPLSRALLGDRLGVIHCDARRLLATRALDQADCIYLDPMFPPKRKTSALAKREIRWVRALVGDDADAAELLAIARRAAGRVVVKRPTFAPPLANDPAASIGSKLVRYDIFTQ